MGKGSIFLVLVSSSFSSYFYESKQESHSEHTGKIPSPLCLVIALNGTNR